MKKVIVLGSVLLLTFCTLDVCAGIKGKAMKAPRTTTRIRVGADGKIKVKKSTSARLPKVKGRTGKSAKGSSETVSRTYQSAKDPSNAFRARYHQPTGLVEGTGAANSLANGVERTIAQAEQAHVNPVSTTPEANLAQVNVSVEKIIDDVFQRAEKAGTDEYICKFALWYDKDQPGFEGFEGTVIEWEKEPTFSGMYTENVQVKMGDKEAITQLNARIQQILREHPDATEMTIWTRNPSIEMPSQAVIDDPRSILRAVNGEGPRGPFTERIYYLNNAEIWWEWDNEFELE